MTETEKILAKRTYIDKQLSKIGPGQEKSYPIKIIDKMFSRLDIEAEHYLRQQREIAMAQRLAQQQSVSPYSLSSILGGFGGNIFGQQAR